MEYKPVPFHLDIEVERMVTVHYFQFARGYVFPGEKHDFWEMVYMDKGAAEIGADGRPFMLSEGEVAFHKPGEFHTIWAGGSNPPDIIIISFVCASLAMRRFAGVRMPVDEESKRFIAGIIMETGNAWSNKLGSHYLELLKRADGLPGAEQMVKLSLEALLIKLLRKLDAAPIKHAGGEAPQRPKTVAGRREYMDRLAGDIGKYIAEHLDENITIGSLCRRFGLSGTSMKLLFKRSRGCGVTGYLSGVRHDAAKRHIREGRLDMKAIAEKCGYNSVHYFSRRFSMLEGMTPSEYSRSVKNLAGLPCKP